MALRAATDSGIVVFPPLPLPTRHNADAPPRESARTKASPRANWRWRIALATLLLAGGFAGGFVARLRLMPPAELGQRRSEVTALMLEQQQQQKKITEVEARVATLTTQLAANQTQLSQANDKNQALIQTQLRLASAAAAERAHHRTCALRRANLRQTRGHDYRNRDGRCRPVSGHQVFYRRWDKRSPDCQPDRHG